MLNIKDNINARLNYNQFYHYMKRTYASDEIAAKVQKIQRILGKNPSKALETIVETNESSISDLRSTDSGKKMINKMYYIFIFYLIFLQKINYMFLLVRKK